MRLTLLIPILAAALPVFADEPTVRVEQLTPTLHLLSTDQGSYTTNSLAFTGGDGLLLVDTQAAADADDFGAAVAKLGHGDPEYIITTHRHVEHIGGNACFGADPVVIAHHLVPAKLTDGPAVFDAWGPEVMPDITVADSLTLFFNGERIRIVAMGGSHDDNELMVHFTGQGVVHLSSLVNGFNFPSVDDDGDALMFAPLVRRALALLPADVTVVSGHNGNGTTGDLARYTEMIDATRELVAAGLATGRSVAEMQEADLLAGWEEYEQSYVSKAEWIEYLAEALEKAATPESTPGDDPFAPVHAAWQNHGADAAVARYRDLVAAGGYDVDPLDLLVIGSKLESRNLFSDSVVYLMAYVTDQADHKYAYFGHYLLAKGHQELGDRDAAVRACRAALAAQPDFGPAEALLENLED
ncbi:MAG: MBL fold metallo-hydrolase [bacterium]|nr:MBL fold metallo-hydrolase [bacterium]